MGHYALLLFVRPSVAYLANNSRTRRSSVPKYGKKVPHLWCDSHTSFKIKRSKVKVTRPINADAHRAPYLLNGKAYELQTWYTDVERRHASATGARLAAGGGIPCRPNPAATFLVVLRASQQVVALAIWRCPATDVRSGRTVLTTLNIACT